MTDRELDRRVAEAMYPGGDLDHPDHPWHECHYSSTFGEHTQEMLEWLRAHCPNRCLGVSEFGLDGGEGWCASIDNFYPDRDAAVGVGDTIPESLAHLVVVVAQQQAAQRGEEADV